MYKKIILLVVIISAANFSLRSQTRGNLHEPTREEMLLRYKKAARLDSAVRTSVYYQYVQPVWFEKGNRFWYQRIHPDSTMEYLEVNPEKGVKKIAFDHSRLAVGLSAVTKKTIQANRLEITINRVDGERKQMEFSHDHKRWELDLISYVIRPVNSNDRNFRWTNGENGWTKRSRWMNFSTDAVSPDKKW
ncbi:hypothetical protein [Flavihumibacter sp. UBA7668]|uniref:hypothetical protein n=1 Tax=Flavihumibacter sp. UBA7668 TaxID=1946542 RepID=UPI0025BCDE6D|nr:hypothetical protein [Flavihumibacter sp. UBA7668]